MHLALKSAMSRIPYTNKVGETLSSIADSAAAYSLRALGGGDPMVARVRRSSDDVEKDFTASDMGAALEDWVGSGNDGHVTSWYDQSGNGRHAEQPTAGNQPKIVSNGAITTDSNGNPAIDFDGVDDFLEMDESTNPFDSDGDLSLFIYCDYSTTTVGGQAYAYKFGASTAGTRFGRAYSTQMRIFHHDGSNDAFVQTTSVPSGDNLFSSVLDKSANVSFYQNGSLIGTANATVLTSNIDASPKVIGAGSTTAVAAYGAPITEIVVYPSDQSSNRAAIETNINNYYDIY